MRKVQINSSAETDLHTGIALDLIQRLQAFNEAEGYELTEIELVRPLQVFADTAKVSAGRPEMYVWYQIKCETQPRYYETGWLAQHPKWGFVYAEHLDGEEI